jgi:aryl-alcohol dehydrogenase (NADP+)
MEFQRLGNSGLKVSRICLGTMTYGTSKWREWVLEESESRPFIEKALELGINFFDTANAYSLGVSEEIVGRALKDFARRDEVVIATKVFFPMGERPNQGGLSRLHIMQAVEDSLRRLGTDYIDLYQIHRWILVDPACMPGSLPNRCTWLICMDGHASCRCRTTTTWFIGKKNVR